MSDMRCPNCGAEVPAESGQHAVSPSAGVVTCPSCGATVTLESPGDRQHVVGEAETAEAAPAPAGRAGEGEYFSGSESVEGVMEELSENEGGPRE
jgi:ribosomal protein S27AE